LADIAVAPWHKFPWGLAPIKLFEYLAAGRAIVASCIDGVADFIQEGETGLLVEPESHQAMAQALIHLLQNPARRARLAANARREAVEKHSWTHRARQLTEIYQSLIGS
jgi:glycosyltransferase involved in cell wall biosynthesis